MHKKARLRSIFLHKHALWCAIFRVRLFLFRLFLFRRIVDTGVIYRL